MRKSQPSACASTGNCPTDCAASTRTGTPFSCATSTASLTGITRPFGEATWLISRSFVSSVTAPSRDSMNAASLSSTSTTLTVTPRSCSRPREASAVLTCSSDVVTNSSPSPQSKLRSTLCMALVVLEPMPSSSGLTFRRSAKWPLAASSFSMMYCRVSGRAGPCRASYSIASLTAFSADDRVGPYVPVWKYPTSSVTGSCSRSS